MTGRKKEQRKKERKKKKKQETGVPLLKSAYITGIIIYTQSHIHI